MSRFRSKAMPAAVLNVRGPADGRLRSVDWAATGPEPHTPRGQHGRRNRDSGPTAASRAIPRSPAPLSDCRMHRQTPGPDACGAVSLWMNGCSAEALRVSTDGRRTRLEGRRLTIPVGLRPVVPISFTTIGTLSPAPDYAPTPGLVSFTALTPRNPRPRARALPTLHQSGGSRAPPSFSRTRRRIPAGTRPR